MLLSICTYVYLLRCWYLVVSDSHLRMCRLTICPPLPTESPLKGSPWLSVHQSSTIQMRLTRLTVLSRIRWCRLWDPRRCFGGAESMDHSFCKHARPLREKFWKFVWEAWSQDVEVVFAPWLLCLILLISKFGTLSASLKVLALWQTWLSHCEGSLFVVLLSFVDMNSI